MEKSLIRMNWRNIKQIQALWKLARKNKYNLLLDKVSPETTLKFGPGDRGYLEQNIDGVTGEAAVSQVKHSHSLTSKS